MRYRKNGLAVYKRRGKALQSDHQGLADCPLADVLGLAQVTGQAENNESSAIPVNFLVVGSPEWLEDKIAHDVITPEQRVEIKNPSDLQPMKDRLNAQPVQGFRMVTIGKDQKDSLDPLSDTSEIVLVQYGTREMVYLIEPDLILEFKDLLQSEEHLKIGHNILVNYEFILAKFDFPIVRMYDTMLAEQLLTAGLENVRVRLKDLARKYPPHHKISNSLRDEFVGFCEDDEDGKFTKEMLRDAAREVHVLFPVSEGQWRELREHGLEDVARDEFRCIPATADIELTGISLDEQILMLNKHYYEQRQDETNAEVQRMYNEELRKRPRKGPEPIYEVEERFNINSPTQKLKVLRELGYKVKNVRRETLEKLKKPFTNLLAEYSRCQKMTSTTIPNLLRGRSPWTGRFHPEFDQLGQGEDFEAHENRKTTTATGRYSSNAQQIPRPQNQYGPVKNQAELAQVETLFAEPLKRGIETCSTVGATAVLLGSTGGKEYYLSPADDKHSEPYIQWRVPEIREAIRARRGYKILAADYSQAEVRIMAALSQDAWLTHAINSGKDIHCYMASEVYGIPYDEFYAAWKDDKHPRHEECSKLRANIKGTTFGVPYGAGPAGVASSTGLSYDAASTLIKGFFAKASGLKTWLDDQRAKAVKLGYSKSPKGRKRYHLRPTSQDEDGLAHIERCGANNPIQSTCADLLKTALPKIYLAIRGGSWKGKMLYDAHIVLCAHDEIVLEVWEDQAHEVGKLVKACMEEAFTDIIKTVSIKVDVTVADYWKK